MAFSSLKLVHWVRLVASGFPRHTDSRRFLSHLCHILSAHLLFFTQFSGIITQFLTRSGITQPSVALRTFLKLFLAAYTRPAGIPYSWNVIKWQLSVVFEILISHAATFTLVFLLTALLTTCPITNKSPSVLFYPISFVAFY